MANLSMFTDVRFDLIMHPVSNVYVPDVKPVWREAFRMLKPGGTLLNGFMNPVHYLFDSWQWRRGNYGSSTAFHTRRRKPEGPRTGEARITGLSVRVRTHA